MTDIAFVRSEIAEAKPAPARTSGIVAWLRQNLFAQRECEVQRQLTRRSGHRHPSCARNV